MSCSTLRPRWTKTACTRCLQWSKTAREHLMQLPILCLWTRKVASPRTVIECKVIEKQNTVTESNTGSLTAKQLTDLLYSSRCNYSIMSETSSGGSQPQPTEIVLAGWGERFLAWLIDFIIVNTVLWAIFAAAAIPFWFDGMPDRWFNKADGPLGWA